MSTQFNNYKVIKFNDYELFLKDEQIIELTDSGFFGIHCFETNKTLLMDSFYVLSSLTNSFYDLERGLFEPSTELLEDFQIFGPDVFAFIIIACGPEYNDVDRLNENFHYLKKSWPYPQYESKGF